VAAAVQPHVTGADPEKQTSDDEQKHNKEDVFAESSPHKNAPAAGGFLEMWKSIKEGASPQAWCGGPGGVACT